MAANLRRRSVAALTVAGLGLAGAPLLQSASASTDVALVSTYPAFNGSVVSGGETLKATFNQAISQDKNVSWFKVFTVSDGQPGNQVRGGSYDFAASKQGGPTDTITFTGPLGVSGQAIEYQAQVRARSADGKSKTANSFFFWVDPRTPQVTSAPKDITSDNQKAVTFKGTAAPGLTVHVDILPSDPSNPPAPPPAVASGTQAVPTTCTTAPNCDWIVKVDASNLPPHTYYWWAYTTDANASSPKTKAKTITKGSSSSVAPPQNVQASMDSKSPTTMIVSACSADPRTMQAPDKWTFDVVVTDQEGHTVVQNGLKTSSSVSGCPPSDPGLDGARIDVGKLDDGSLTPTVYAVDPDGNVSSGTSGSAATKATAFDLDFANSSLATPSNPTVTFPDAQAHLVQSPSSVQLRFSQPVKASFTDSGSGPPTTYNSKVCIADRTGACVVYTTSPSISDDGFTMTVPVSGKLVDNFAPYTIRVQTYEKNLCPDRTPFNANNGWQCYTLYTRWNGTAKDGTAPATSPSDIHPVTIRQSIDPSAATFEFRLDDVPPAVKFTSFSPTHITRYNNRKISVAGTTDKDTTGVRVVIRSTHHGTPVIVNVPVTPSSEATSLPWSASNVNLSGVPDGLLHVTATATDAAGNRTPKPVTFRPWPVLRAHPSRLTEHTSARTVLYGRKIRLHGRLTDVHSRKGLGHAVLTIRPRFDNHRFGHKLTVHTSRYGYWSRWLRPAHNATYWVTYAGTTSAPLHGAVTTHAARTRVRVRIWFTSPKYGAHVGRRVTLRGRVWPNKHGYFVYFYRHAGHRSIYLGRTRLGHKSYWAFKVSLPRGTDYVFARFPNHRGNLGKRTGFRRLFVR